jgi:hypothetical protein
MIFDLLIDLKLITGIVTGLAPSLYIRKSNVSYLGVWNPRFASFIRVLTTEYSIHVMKK